MLAPDEELHIVRRSREVEFYCIALEHLTSVTLREEFSPSWREVSTRWIVSIIVGRRDLSRVHHCSQTSGEQIIGVIYDFDLWFSRL